MRFRERQQCGSNPVQLRFSERDTQVRNIYRYLNEGVTPELDNLVKLLLAMNIPLRLSEALLYSAGYILNSSAKNVLYSILLENHSAVGGILEANEIIEEYNRTVRKEVIPLFKLN